MGAASSYARFCEGDQVKEEAIGGYLCKYLGRETHTNRVLEVRSKGAGRLRVMMLLKLIPGKNQSV